ncbi:large ribosomal subunit protein bL32m-like [Ptychodera flava]|uniref:large ribosomal subunit protein bL32m-like n=1 Tax=Ptychodera flava TaxID=63121 RepID=UPI00396A9930
MAAYRLLARLRLSLQCFEAKVHDMFSFNPPLAPALATNSLSSDYKPQSSRGIDMKELWSGILFAVPKSKRSLERRRTRRRAIEKRIHPREDIVACESCGYPRLLYHLCGHCIEKVRAETELIREKLGDEWNWNTPQTETVVLYEGERANESDKKKHIVEVKKKRPSWFSKDLFQRQ